MSTLFAIFGRSVDTPFLGARTRVDCFGGRRSCSRSSYVRDGARQMPRGARLVADVFACSSSLRSWEASLKTFASDTVLALLAELQAQQVRYRDHRAQLDAAYITGDIAQAAAGLEGVRQAFDDLTTTYVHLRRHVVAFDRAIAGAGNRSFEELALRGKMTVVTVQLQEFADALGADSHGATVGGAALFSGRFRCLEDLASFVREVFAQICDTWLVPGDRHREAIRHARHALIAVSNDPDLVAFVRAGAARADVPAVHAASGRLAQALHITRNDVQVPADAGSAGFMTMVERRVSGASEA
ncbi:MAG: hypothetical protein ABIY55_09885 [Kofleriaceae bacterium]